MIKDTNTRISVTISKENRDKLKKIADKNGRSMSNMVKFLILDCIERSDKK